MIEREPEPISAVVRELAEMTTDGRRKDRLHRLAILLKQSIQEDNEAATQEALDRLSLGNDVLTLLREERDNRRETAQTIERIFDEIDTIRKACTAIQAAQSPESLAERLRQTYARPMTAAQRVEAIRQAMTELDALLAAAQRDAFIEATAENASALLDTAERVTDQVAGLRGEVGGLRSEVGELRARLDGDEP